MQLGSSNYRVGQQRWRDCGRLREMVEAYHPAREHFRNHVLCVTGKIRVPLLFSFSLFFICRQFEIASRTALTIAVDRFSRALLRRSMLYYFSLYVADFVRLNNEFDFLSRAFLFDHLNAIEMLFHEWPHGCFILVSSDNGDERVGAYRTSIDRFLPFARPACMCT